MCVRGGGLYLVARDRSPGKGTIFEGGLIRKRGLLPLPFVGIRSTGLSTAGGSPLPSRPPLPPIPSPIFDGQPRPGVGDDGAEGGGWAEVGRQKPPVGSSNGRQWGGGWGGGVERRTDRKSKGGGKVGMEWSGKAESGCHWEGGKGPVIGRVGSPADTILGSDLMSRAV